MERFPEEQASLTRGFQNYWKGYAKVFSDLEDSVRQKLDAASAAPASDKQGG